MTLDEARATGVEGACVPARIARQVSAAGVVKG